MRFSLEFISWIIVLAALIFTSVFFIFAPHYFSHKKNSWWHLKEKAVVWTSSISFFALITLLYSFVEPQQIIVRHEAIELGLKQPLRIALISDIQAYPLKNARFVERAVAIILEEQPDAVLNAGDFINNEFPLDEELPHLQPLKKLAEQIPSYGVLGNHGYGISNPLLPATRIDSHGEVQLQLEKLGTDMLVNEYAVITKNNQPILELFGFDDLWNPAFIEPTITPKTELPRLAISHNPDAIYYLDESTADMVVSGHTHGGQIRLPFVGSLVNAGTRLHKKFYKRLSEHHGVKLYVTSGLGESGMPVRLFNLPEIVILEIT